jgi:hypothetical protein
MMCGDPEFERRHVPVSNKARGHLRGLATVRSPGAPHNNLIPLNATGAELPFALRSESNASADYWIKLVSRARKRLYLAGIGFTGWRGIPGMREALRDAAASGCEIRVLTMDANNPAFGYMLNDDVTAASSANQAPSISETRTWFKSALGNAPNSDVRALNKGMLFQQIVVSDDQALISPYLFSSNTGYSPRLDINERCPVFESFLREFEELWKANSRAELQREEEREALTRLKKKSGQV